MKVVFILGSEVDKDHAGKIRGGLEAWGIESEVIVASAHKVPEKVFEIVSYRNTLDEPLVYVTIAGRSNGLSGVVAANSIHPVFACPPFKDKSDMIVNLNSTMQMPSGTPVITVIDPKNCVLAIARIFGLIDEKAREANRAQIDESKAKYE
jgi:phosphoribosylaminoimidazole carboxylase PurE protein